jgi:ribonuclease HI
MEHILTQSDENGQKGVWELVSELWKLKTGIEMPPPLMGEIMACGLIKKGNIPGKTDTSTTRLYRIIVTESTHLIWHLRNE